MNSFHKKRLSVAFFCDRESFFLLFSKKSSFCCDLLRTIAFLRTYPGLKEVANWIREQKFVKKNHNRSGNTPFDVLIYSRSERKEVANWIKKNQKGFGKLQSIALINSRKQNDERSITKQISRGRPLKTQAV